MNIFLLGATGRVGQEIAKKALADQHHVTALIRNPEKTQIESPHLTVVQGNALNQSDILRAMERTDMVVSALGTDKSQTLSKSMPLIIQAMGQHKLSRIVTIGTAGILNSRTESDLYRFQSSESKRRPTTAAEDHLAAYLYLKESQLTWTVVSPTYLPEGGETGDYRAERNILPENGKRISVGDTAAFAYLNLSQSEFLNTRVGLAY